MRHPRAFFLRSLKQREETIRHAPIYNREFKSGFHYTSTAHRLNLYAVNRLIVTVAAVKI
jgi:hypothetical protein